MGKYVYVLGGLKKVVLKKYWGHLGVRKWPPKFHRAIKKSKFNLVVEYPIWVSIKRTLAGKLAVGGWNFIYCAQFGENCQNQGIFRIQFFLKVFGRFLLIGQSN